MAVELLSRAGREEFAVMLERALVVGLGMGEMASPRYRAEASIGRMATFDVFDTESPLLQRAELPFMKGKLDFEATSSAVFYNQLTINNVDPFSGDSTTYKHSKAVYSVLSPRRLKASHEEAMLPQDRACVQISTLLKEYPPKEEPQLMSFVDYLRAHPEEATIMISPDLWHLREDLSSPQEPARPMNREDLLLFRTLLGHVVKL